MNTLLVVLLLVVTAVSISQLGVILFLVRFIKKNELHDTAVKDMQDKSATVIADAVSKATTMVADAQKVQIDKVAEESKALTTLSEKFEQNMQTLEQTTQTELQESAKKAEASYTQFVTASQTTLDNLLTQDKQLIEQKTNEVVSQSSTMFQQAMAGLSDQIRQQLQQEIELAKKEVDAYKDQRLATINEKIVDIIEEVILETLGKKLSVKDEGEFVFQALETAKREHVLN